MIVIAREGIPDRGNLVDALDSSSSRDHNQCDKQIATSASTCLPAGTAPPRNDNTL